MSALTCRQPREQATLAERRVLERAVRSHFSIIEAIKYGFEPHDKMNFFGYANTSASAP
jgi:hypothetical protein